MRTIFMTAFFLIFTNQVMAQDPIFSSYFMNPNLLNPALTGTGVGCDRLSFIYKSQFTRLYQSSNYINATYERLSPFSFGAFAASLNRFEEGNGVLSRTFVDLIYSHHVVINTKNRLYLGFQGGIFNRAIDWSKLVFPDQLDPKFGNVFSSEALKIVDSRFNADFSGGIAFKHSFKKDYGFVVGVSSRHITSPEEGLIGLDRTNLPTRNTVHANVLLPMNYARENFLKRIVASFVYQQQGPLASTQLGIALKSEFITFAINYRYHSKLNLITQPDALTISVRFQNFRQTEYRKVKSPFEFGVTHDITYNQIGYGSLGGSPELCFSYMPSGVECSGPVKGKKRKIPKFMRRLKVTGSSLESKTKLEEYF